MTPAQALEHRETVLRLMVSIRKINTKAEWNNWWKKYEFVIDALPQDECNLVWEAFENRARAIR